MAENFGVVAETNTSHPAVFSATTWESMVGSVIS